MFYSTIQLQFICYNKFINFYNNYFKNHTNNNLRLNITCKGILYHHK